MRLSVIVSVLCLLVPSSVAADDTTVDGGTTEGGLIADAVNDTRGSADIKGSGAQTTGPRPNVTVQLSGDPCDGEVEVIEGDNPAGVFFCNTADPEEPVLTAGMIRRAFAELRLPASTLVIQPPDGLTLVNFDTNFYTTSTRPLTRTVTLLGQRVTLEATPSTYHWTFGDGRELSTSHPGAPYPDLTVTHNYLRKGTYRPSLATTYTGRYRVGGGPWRSITGTVTIDGSGQPLRAIEAQPKLVGY